METQQLVTLTGLWQKLCAKAQSQYYISYSELFEIYKETHKAFCLLENDELVSREAFNTIMLMDEFTYYATMINEDYLGEIASGLYRLNYALKQEFFRGNYQSEFFMGAQPEKVTELVSNIEKLSLEEFVAFMKDEA